MKVQTFILFSSWIFFIPAVSCAQVASIEAVIGMAEKHLGLKHCLRTNSKNCMDCSLLTQTSYAMAGIELPRVSRHQAAAPGQRIAELAGLQRGDLICFAWKGGPVSHVGIVTENNGSDVKFIHTSLSGGVREDWYNSWNNKIFQWGVRLIDVDHQAIPQPRKTDKPKAPKIESSSIGRLFPQGSQKYLKAADLKNLEPHEIKIMKNEIYAKYGYEFHRTGSMIRHFANNTWYQSIPKTTRDAGKIYAREMTDIERSNVDLLIRYESGR